eukprot:GHVR01165147.1.p1 GENE.GHVR01165147.1~~GHVR01165147.1.p1  ORF type:complete len:115 (+),score=27.22 GHVR01165147.1:78-422(+)
MCYIKLYIYIIYNISIFYVNSASSLIYKYLPQKEIDGFINKFDNLIISYDKVIYSMKYLYFNQTQWCDSITTLLSAREKDDYPYSDNIPMRLERQHSCTDCEGQTAKKKFPTTE